MNRWVLLERFMLLAKSVDLTFTRTVEGGCFIFNLPAKQKARTESGPWQIFLNC
jgi:hypothetical protein